MTVRTTVLISSCVGVLALAPSAGQTILLAAQQPAAAMGSSSVPSSARRAPDSASEDYVIGGDDLLSVVFWRDQQLSADVLVRPDGKISLPLLDDVKAAGLTPRQLRDQIATQAKGFMAEPVVTVIVKQINSRKVYITGQIARPGQYPLTPGMTVLQLIATAGGFGDYAKTNDIRVVRVEGGQSVTLHFDYDDMTNPRKKTPSFDLKAGDTVIVR